MSDKILIADLVAAVADSTSFSKTRCDDFVKSFFEAIANALAVDGVAKVKGLGTFKLVQVDERKSVNVQTGAVMIIPAHNKVSFVPDRVLKDDINKPFAHLKTYVVKDDAPLDPPEQEDDETVADNDLASDNTDATSVVVSVNEFATSSEELGQVDETEKTVTEVPVADDVQTQTTSEAIDELKTDIPSQEEESSEQIAEEVISEIKNETSSHSDYYDNWEIEYDAPKQNENNTTDEDLNEQRPATTSLSSLIAAMNKAKEEEVDKADESDSVAVSVKSSQTEDCVEASKEESVCDSNGDETESAETTKVEVEQNRIEVTETEVKRSSFNEEVETEVKSKETSDVEVEAMPEQTEVNGDNTTIQKNAIENESSVSVSGFNKSGKVDHGKVLGVAIIAFLVFLGSAIWGIKKIDPDFFDGLKASSDVPPVMPLDTTSLAQELSEYTNQTDNADDSLVEQQIVNELTEQLSSAPVEQSADPLWDGEFVAFMNRLYPQCSLVTKGMKDEYTIKTGDIMTVIALEYYGDKSYWVYLYLYNKDRIKNPNQVRKGTKIRIPNLDKSLVDGDNERTVSVAKEVRAFFVK